MATAQTPVAQDPARPVDPRRPCTVPVVKELLDKNIDALRRALPRHVTPERLIRVVVTAITRNPKLQECTQNSLMGCILQSAFLGLEPNGPLQEAAIIPFNNTKRRIVEAQFIPMYQGLIKLARNSDQLSLISAQVVKEKDRFSYEYGLHPRLDHAPHMAGERGKTIACYAVFHLKDGSTDFEVMSVDDLNKIRARSRASGDGPWVTDTDEMYKKTVIRRLLKRAPKSVELARALTMDAEIVPAESRIEFGSVFAEAGIEPPEAEAPEIEPPARKSETQPDAATATAAEAPTHA